jgi:hypothetical protein
LGIAFRNINNKWLSNYSSWSAINNLWMDSDNRWIALQNNNTMNGLSNYNSLQLFPVTTRPWLAIDADDTFIKNQPNSEHQFGKGQHLHSIGSGHFVLDHSQHLFRIFLLSSTKEIQANWQISYVIQQFTGDENL